MIPINPKLPHDFINKPIEERSEEELAEWYGKPYIVTCTWEQHQADASYNDFIERMASYGGMADYVPPSRENWEQDQDEQRRRWFEAWPNGGIRFEVNCLDGGAWDRPTWWGAFQTLDEAIACAETGPVWMR